MQEPNAYREAGVTYFVPAFTDAEKHWIEAHRLMAVVYTWRHKQSGKTGQHTIFVWTLATLPVLLRHWNKATTQWEYSLCAT